MTDRYLSEEEKEKRYGERCPKCRESWTKTPRPVVSGFYWHCKTCEKKAEDLVPPPLPKEQAENDFLKEFEAMLGDGKDDWWTFLRDKSAAQRVEIAQWALHYGVITTPQEYLAIINPKPKSRFKLPKY